MKQSVLGSLLVLFVLLEAALAFPGNLTIEASSAEAVTARVTNVELQGKLISDEPVPSDPQRKGRSEEPLQHPQDGLQEEAWSKEHPQDGRQEEAWSKEHPQDDLQEEAWSKEHPQDGLQEEARSKEHPQDVLQERGRSEDASFFGRLLDAIKSFREGYSLRETMKKCVKVVFVYKQPFDN
jgi:hypothetical protein